MAAKQLRQTLPSLESLEPRLLMSGSVLPVAAPLSLLASPTASALTVSAAPKAVAGKPGGTVKDDYGNTTATAASLTLSGTGTAQVSGTVNFAGDVDYFAFTALADGQIKISLAPTGKKTLGGVLTAYDSAGATLAVNTAAGAGKTAAVSFTGVAGQKYYIKVSGTGTTTGTYTASITAAVPAPAPAPDPAPAPAPGPSPTPQPTWLPGAADYLPGTAVSYQVVSTSGGQVLVVLGTGANDVITVSQAADRITLTTSAGSQDVAGSFAGIALYGFGGADTLRLTYSVTAQHAIYGGDGNDQIFDNAQGAGWDYGNAGDDLIVTIGGGADTVWGGAGLVSFWVDSSDAIADATAAEIAAGSIHTISQFYQPYTTDPTAANYVSLNINGQNLADPTASYAYQSFAAKPLFTDGPDYRDIAQGQVGDCYFLAALASIADTHPDIIRQAIAPLGGCLWKPGRIPRSLAVRTTHLCVAPAVQGAGRCLETVHRRAGRPVRGVGGLRDGPCPSCWPRTEVSPGDGLWAADNKIDRRRNRVSWRNGN